MRRLRIALLLALTGILPLACGASQTRDDGPPATRASSSEIPAFQIRTVDGKQLRSTDHVGKDVVLISFWATWCKPCKAEFPFLQDLHERLADRGLTVLVISLDGPETQAEVRPFLRRNHYTMTAAVDRTGRLAARLNPRAAVPFGMLIGRDGRVHKTFEGFQPGERDAVEAEVLGLLAPPDAPAPTTE